MSEIIAIKHTKIPNDLLDKHMADMGVAELKVVLFAMRQTLGYHRGSDGISLSQFMKATGLSRQGVLDGIDKAKKRGVLCEAGHGKRGVVVYGIEVEALEKEPATSQASRHTKEKELKDNLERKKEGAQAPTPPIADATPLSPSMANAVEDAAQQSYQPIDNHTAAMAQADVFIRAFEGACKAWNAPQTVPRTRANRRIAAQWYVDGYTTDEIRTAVNDTFDAGKQVSFAFFGEKLALSRNASRPASIKGVKPRTSNGNGAHAPPLAPSTSEGFSGMKARLQAEQAAKQGAK